jgi:hypothetical protein
MKKLHRSIAILFTACFLHVFVLAQPLRDLGYSKLSIAKSKITAPNFQADKHFRHTFKNATDEKWSKKRDGYRVSFFDNDVRVVVDYDKKGRWVSTVKNYDEALLSKEIADAVMTAFLGYSIVRVIEIQTKKALVHLVKIENKTLLKTVRVINGEMDVIEEYRKQ